MAINNNLSSNNTTQTPQRQGSGFTNLSNILAANSSNRLGQAVGTGISNAASGVRQGINQTSQQFQNQANANNLASDQNTQIRQQALQQIGQGNTTIDPSTQQKFQQFTAGKYAGPTQLDPTQLAQLQNKTGAVQSYGQALRGGGDKSQVLQAFVGKGPNYSTGQQNLDALLLGKGPGAAQQLSQAAKSTTGLGQQLAQAQNTAGQVAQANTARATQFGQDTNKMLTTQQQGIADAAQQALKNYTDQRSAQYNQALSSLQGGNISNSGLAGIDALKGATTYGVDPTKFLNQGAAPDINSVATNQQRAQEAALAQLAGQGPSTYLDTSYTGAAYDPSKASTFDTTGFQNAADAQKAAYNSALLNTTLQQTTGGAPTQLAPGEQGWNLNQAAASIPRLQQNIAIGNDPGHNQYVLNQIQDALSRYAAQYGANKTLT